MKSNYFKYFVLAVTFLQYFGNIVDAAYPGSNRLVSKYKNVIPFLTGTKNYQTEMEMMGLI